MLTKAILTGGVLSVLAGSIVYFGTEGVDASEVKVSEEIRVEDTDLAGAPDVSLESGATVESDISTEEIGEMDSETEAVDDLDADPTPKEQKSNLLDQYLKSRKSKEAGAAKDTNEAVDAEDADVVTETVTTTVTKKIVIETEETDDNDVLMSEGEDLDVENLDLENMGLEEAEKETIRDALRGTDKKDVQVRVMKMDKSGGVLPSRMGLPLKPVDYAAVLAEAKKLQVIDMRDQAVLEILDYAIDRGDIAESADMVDELSTAELRDTARARIGAGLARRGDMKAAFAVLDALEIDELVAPIRLEIITALMATREERTVPQKFREVR